MKQEIIKPTEPTVEKMIKEHEEWLSSGKGKRADFSYMDLSNCAMTGRALNGAIFTGAVLDNSELSRSTLAGVVLDKASCKKTSFVGSDLNNASAKDADFEEAFFADSVLAEANFTRSNLESASMSRADMVMANFYNANMKDVYIPGTNLTGAKGIISIANEYPYVNYGYIYKDVPRVRLGCYDRTLEQWDKDFWNNPDEFPKASGGGEIRYETYLMIKNYLLNYIKRGTE